MNHSVLVTMGILTGSMQTSDSISNEPLKPINHNPYEV
jgi:hypothetical protein